MYIVDYIILKTIKATNWTEVTFIWTKNTYVYFSEYLSFHSWYGISEGQFQNFKWQRKQKGWLPVTLVLKWSPTCEQIIKLLHFLNVFFLKKKNLCRTSSLKCTSHTAHDLKKNEEGNTSWNRCGQLDDL